MFVVAWFALDGGKNLGNYLGRRPCATSTCQRIHQTAGGPAWTHPFRRTEPTIPTRRRLLVYSMKTRTDRASTRPIGIAELNAIRLRQPLPADIRCLSCQCDPTPAEWRNRVETIPTPASLRELLGNGGVPGILSRPRNRVWGSTNT